MKHKDQSFPFFLFVIFILVFQGCDTRSSDRDTSPKQVKVQTKDPSLSDGGQDSTSNFKSEFIPESLNSPYRVILYHTWVNFPDGESMRNRFEQEVKATIDTRYPNLCNFTLIRENYTYVSQAMSESSFPKNNKELSRMIQGYDMAFVAKIEKSLGNIQIKVRQIQADPNRISPVITQNLGVEINIAHVFLSIFHKLFALEGYFTGQKEGNLYKILIRGDTRSIEQFGIKSDDIFWISKCQSSREKAYYSLIQNSFFRVLRTVNSAFSYIVEGESLGWYNLKPGDRISRLYFSRGSQVLKVIGPSGEPKDGFHIFGSHRGYSQKSEDYLGATDISGEFVLNDKDGRLIYTTITSYIQDIHYIFAERMIAVQSGLEPVEIRIEDLSQSAFLDALTRREKRLSQEESIEANRRIESLKEKARLEIKQGYYDNAVKSIETAIIIAQKIENKETEIKSLRDILDDLQKVRAQKEEREIQNAAHKKSLSLIEMSEKDVENTQYEDGIKKLKEAVSLWPPCEKKVNIRVMAIQRLIQEKDQPVGKAREFIRKEAINLTEEKATPEFFQKLQENIEILIKEDVQEPDTPYNDKELIHQLKVGLDKFSENILKKGEEIQKMYEKSKDVSEKERLFKESKRYYKIREMTDEVILKIP